MDSTVSVSFKPGSKTEIVKVTTTEEIANPTQEKVAAYLERLRRQGFWGNVRMPRDLNTRPFVVEREEFVPFGPQLLLG